MAKSALERKREQIERDREALRVMPDTSYPYLRTKFFEWVRDHPRDVWSNFETEFMAAGFEPPEFKDDSGPRSLDGVHEQLKGDGFDDLYAGYQGSVGRAESIVDFLLSSAWNLAHMLNEYKVEQIEARIMELEAADFSDPDAKKRALADAVTLTSIRKQLQGQTRYSLPAYKVKGI